MINVFVAQQAGPQGVITAVMTAAQLADCLNKVPGALMQIDYNLLKQVDVGTTVDQLSNEPGGTTQIPIGVVTITPLTFSVG